MFLTRTYTNPNNVKYNTSFWVNIKNWLLPRLGFIINVAYAIALIVLVLFIMIGGLYIYLEPFKEFIDRTPFKIIISNEVREKCDENEWSNAKIFFLLVFIRNCLLIGIAVLFRWLFVTGRINIIFDILGKIGEIFKF